MKVTAKVLAHVRGEKLRVFKFKPKRGYKRRTGHRQELTRIEVTEIATGGAKPRKPRRAERGAETRRGRESRGDAESRRPKSAPRKAKARRDKRNPRGRAKPPARSSRQRKAKKETDGRWLIRRGSDRAATAATPTPSGSA